MGRPLLSIDVSELVRTWLLSVVSGGWAGPAAIFSRMLLIDIGEGVRSIRDIGVIGDLSERDTGVIGDLSIRDSGVIGDLSRRDAGGMGEPFREI